MDQQWRFVGNKKNQPSLWYAWEPRFKRIIAHAFWHRTDATLKKLLKLLEPYQFMFYSTVNWKYLKACCLQNVMWLEIILLKGLSVRA